MDLSYDVNAWYSQKSTCLYKFKKPTKNLISPDIGHAQPIIKEGERLFGKNVRFRTGKILTNWSLKNFWYKSVALEMESMSQTKVR